MEQQYTLLGLLKLFWKWRKAIILACAVAGVVSIVASLSLDNYYQASTTFYPASQDNFMPEKVFGGGVDFFYGSREDLDRLLAITQSNDIKDFLIDSFNLHDVYEIDRDDPKASLKVHKALDGLLTISKTKFSAVDVSVEDKDPKLAADMANATREKARELLLGMMSEMLLSTKNTIENDLRQKEILVEQLKDSIQLWRAQYGIYDTDAQAEVLSTLVAETESKLNRERAKFQELRNNPLISPDTIAILGATLKGLEKEYEALTSDKSKSKFNLNSFNKGKEKIRAITQRIDIENTQINYQKLKASQYKIATDFDFNALFTIEEATVPYEKSRPRRSILVIASVLAAFILSLIAVLISDLIKSVKWSEV